MSEQPVKTLTINGRTHQEIEEEFLRKLEKMKHKAFAEGYAAAKINPKTLRELMQEGSQPHRSAKDE